MHTELRSINDNNNPGLKEKCALISFFFHRCFGVNPAQINLFFKFLRIMIKVVKVELTKFGEKPHYL